MIRAKSDNGNVEVYEIQGSIDKVICDIGALAVKVLLIMANAGAKSKGDVYIKYGLLARKLVDYIDHSVEQVDDSLEGKKGN